jgi:peptide/nickel transport system permease protein
VTAIDDHQASPPDPLDVVAPSARRWVDRAARGERRFLDRNLPLIAGVSIIAVVTLLAIAVPLFWPVDSNTQDLLGRLRPPMATDDDGAVHLFGTDALGRDVFARVFVGARYSLVIAAASVIGSMLLGTVVGLIAGYRGGRLDDVLGRVVDLQLAFPLVLLALALVALLGPSAVNVVIVFVLTGWPIFARTVRASTLTLRDRAFIDAARTVGAGHPRIMFRHILPNAVGTLIVVATFELAKVLIYESSLSFLGLGVQPPTPTWGNMMADGRNYLQVAWWITFFPGITLVLTAAAANWLGDGLTQHLDPRSRQR